MATSQLKLFGKRPKDRRGGARLGAGRPKSPNSGESRLTRPSLSRHHAVHVTVRLRSRLRNLRARKPSSLEVVTLLTKPERREIDVPVRYVGFEIPNRFVIGNGLDFAERYRNLPYVGVLRDELARQAE